MPKLEKTPLHLIAIGAIIVLVSAVALGVVWFLGANTKEHIEKTIVEQFGEQELAIAGKIVKTLEAEITNVEEKLALIAQIPEVRNGSSETCSKKLKEISAGLHVPLGNLGRMNKEGIFDCSVVDSLIGVDGKQYDYLRTILNDPEHRPVLSRAILFEYTDRTEYLSALHVPRFDSGGAFIGTVGGAIYFAELQEKYLEDVESPQRGYAVLLDDNGDLLHHPNADFVSRNANDAYMQGVFSESQELQDLIKDAQAGLTGTRIYTYLGESKLAAFRPAHIFESRYWPVIVTITLAETAGVVAPLVSKLQYQVLIVMGILALLALGMIIFLMRLNQVLNRKVTERTSELEAAKKKSEILLASIGDGVVAIDRHWDIIAWNGAASTIAGWTKTEALGRPFREVIKLIRERDRTENIEFIEDAMVKGQARTMEDHTVLVTKDGKEIPVGDSAAPVLDSSGKVIGGIIIFRDMSKEREARALRSDFAYASHQLRTPVNQALWNLETALEEKNNQKMREDVRVAYLSVQATQKLVNQLLEVSEIDQGTIIPKVEVVRLTNIFDEILNIISVEAKARNITLSVAPISPVISLKTDPKLFKRILLEVLENALYYSSPKSTVNMRTAIQEDGILIEIQDSGIGIPQNQQSLVFTKFFRGENIDATTIIGAGLGLCISREYVRLLKGKMWFKSEENKGTTFYIFFPEKG